MFNMKIYFVACNKASVRRFNRWSVSARSVLRSNQAATVCLRPSYRPVTVSLFYRPHRQTAVWIMIKLERVVDARLSPDHLPVSYYLADVALSASPSTVRSLVCSPGSCSAVRRPFAGRPHCPHLPSTARRLFAGTRSFLRFPPRCSCYRLSVVSMVLRWRQRRPPKHVLSYENGGCQFTGLFPYGLLIGSFNQVSRSKLISFGFNLAYG